MRSIICVLMFCWSVLAHSGTVHQAIVFGDSLSDNGNMYEYLNHQLPISPPYYQGRFTDGPVWIELLLKKVYAKDFNEHLKDYAYAGAGVSVTDDNGMFNLQNQVSKYFSEFDNKAYANKLYVVWLGANNYFNLPENQEAVVKEVVAGIRQSIEQLIHQGAKDILVLNVPDLSKTPAAVEFGAESDLRYMSLEHNLLLANMLSEVRGLYPSINLIDYDVTKVMNNIIEHPDSYGFTNVTNTCFEHLDEPNTPIETKHSLFLKTLSSKPYSTESSCSGYLFFDLYHPTAHAHRIMANEILKLLKDNQVIFK